MARVGPVNQFEVFVGENRDIEVSLADSDGSPFDLTGWGIAMRAVLGSVTMDKTLGEGITVDDPTTGVLSIAIGPEDLFAGNWQIEIRITDSDSIVTVFRGVMVVRPSLFGD